MSDARIPLPVTDSTDLVARSALGHQPETLAAFQALYAQLWSGGVVEPALKELARLRNARVTGCTICRNLRFSIGDEALVPECDVDEIRDGYRSGPLSPVQKAILGWADVFLAAPATLAAQSGSQGPSALPEAAELVRHLDPAQIVEITATLALCMGFSKIAIALGPMPDDMPTLRTPMPGSEPART